MNLWSKNNAVRIGLNRRATGDERRAMNLLYNCRERTTNRTFFMQNEPNFQKVKFSATGFRTMNYAKWTLGERGKNKAKTNPIKANLSCRSLWRSRIKPNSNHFPLPLLPPSPAASHGGFLIFFKNLSGKCHLPVAFLSDIIFYIQQRTYRTGNADY